MVAQALRPEVGAVGAILLYPDGKIQQGGVVLGINGLAGHLHRHYQGNAPGYVARMLLPYALSAVTAACLVVRKALYQQVGGLDEENLPIVSMMWTSA